MKKLILLLIFIPLIGAFSQSSFTITPNPTASGTVSDLKIDAQGKILKATQTYYYNASNLDFLPISSNSTEFNKFTREDFTTSICYFSTAANESSYMVAPVDLADGATITRLKTFYIDNIAAENMTIELIRRLKSLTTATDDVIATNTTPNTNSANIRTVQATVSASNVIDNLTYHYFIKVKIGDFTGDATQQWRGALLGIRDVELQYTY
jgi:hypothetical protein